MQRESLSIEGFLAYSEPVTIHYSQGNISAVTGKNGTGKTSIPDAIAWVRYGQLRVHRDGDSVINDFCEEAHVVEVVKDRAGHRWKFDRKKRREKPQVLSVFSWNSITKEWERYGTKNISDNTEIINDLVGINRDAFYSLSLFDSKNGSRGIKLVSVKPEDRIDILTSLKPNLSIWPSVNKRVKEELKEARKSKSVQEEKIAYIKSMYDNLYSEKGEIDDFLENSPSLQSLDNEIKQNEEKLKDCFDEEAESKIEIARLRKNEIVRDKEQELNRLGDEIAELQSRIGVINNRNDLLEDFEHDIHECNESKKEIAAVKKKASASLSKLKRSLKKETDNKSKSDEAIASLHSRIESLEVALDSMDERLRVAESSDGQCLVCGSSISEEKANDIIDGISDEIDSAEEELDSKKSELKQEQKDRKEYSALIRKYETSITAAEKQMNRAEKELSDVVLDLREIENEKKRLLATVKDEDSIEELEDQIAEIKSLRDKKEKVFLKKEKEQSDWIKQIKGEMPKSQDIAALERAIDRLNKQRDERVGKSSQSEQIEKQINDVLDQIQEEKEVLQERIEEVDDLTILSEATSQKGIPYLMLSDMLTLVERKADEFLALINNDPDAMRIDLVQDYESTKKTRIDIMVNFADSSYRPIEALSNGEVTRVSIALMFALIHVVNMSRPETITDVFLDEPLESVDDLGIEGVMPAFREAIRQGIIHSVMVVSHNRNIINACDREIAIGELKDNAEVEV